MISRVADHCFWLGRYLERAENTARVLGATHNLALDAELPASQVWLPVVIVAGEEERFAERFGPSAHEDGETVERYMTWDEDNWIAILRSVGAIRENARSVRDVVSLEAWEPVNELHLYLQSNRAREEWRDHRYGFYAHVRHSTQLALGLMRSTMLHDSGLDFIWLGTMLERGSQTARMLDVHHHALSGEQVGATSGASAVVENAIWVAILRACSGYEPFMKHARGQITGRAVARFLLLEAKFPRSVSYCIHAARQRLAAIRPPDKHELPGGQTLERLRVLDEVMHRKDAADGENLHDSLTHVVDETAAVCDGLGRELFGYAPVTAAAP